MANEFRKKNILVTGATGFIGRHLVKKLVDSNRYSVVAISRSHEKVKKLEKLALKAQKADITIKADLDKLNKFPIDIIIHCAASVESLVSLRSKNQKILNKINIEGTENICKLAIELGVEKVIYISSVAVVSGNREVPLVEDLPFLATSNYGLSKLEAEKKALLYRRKGLPLVILRPPIVYGEDEPHVFPLLLKLLRYRLIPLINQGRARLHMVYIENLIAAIFFALESQNMLEDSFFVADKEALNVSQVFASMAKGLGVKEPLCLPSFFTPLFSKLLFFGKYFSLFSKDRVYSTKRIESLGFRPPYQAKEALIKSCRNYKKN